MASIDFEIDSFYNEMAALRLEINSIDYSMKEFEKNRRQYPQWRMKDGRFIKISDISDEHLNNLICFIKRKGQGNDRKWLWLFENELNYRKNKAIKEDLLKTLEEYEEVENNCL